MKNYELLELKNGLRLACMPYKSAVSYMGIILNVGSIDEKDHEHGIAHFIEHLLFKGTSRRNSHKIINHLEMVGGELNAFTTKEETNIYSLIPNSYYKRAIDLLCDICFRSIFPEKHLANERNVILDEITSYKDTPSENIFDEFDELMLAGHPLAHNILGSEDSLAQMTRAQIVDFHHRMHINSNPVFFYMGDVPLKKITEQLEKNTEGLLFEKKNKTQEAFEYRKVHREIEEETYQAHYITGMTLPGYNSQDRIPIVMLNNLLGGPSMNSMLNMSLREKNGIAYNVESTYIPYAQFGTINIYFGTDEKKLAKSMHIVNAQLKKLREKKLSPSKLTQFKKQFYGQLAISLENKENKFLSFGKNILRHNKYPSLDETYRLVEAVKADTLWELSNLYLDPKSYSSLTIL